MGRPSSYTPEIAAEICAMIREGESLRRICQLPEMPGLQTVMDWLTDDSKADFRSKYARARELQGDVMDARILETAEAVLDGSVDPNAGKVAISAFQWRASKLQPKVYGDATLLKHGDHEGNVLKVQISQVTGTDE